MSYILAHWRGQQSLAWSFWVNFAAIRLCIFLAENNIPASFFQNRDAALWIGGTWFLTFHVALLAWQIIGLLRASDRYYRAAGSMELVWAINASVVAALIVTSLALIDGLQRAFADNPQNRELISEIYAKERASQYSLKVLTINAVSPHSVVEVKGSFELGIASRLKTLLQRNPGVKGIILNSNGGRIYEGRGIASLAQLHELETYVLESCNSACTTAFIGGATRVLGAKGKLGFHQYWHDAQLQHPFVNLEEEQNKDREFYKSKKISDDFLRRVFDRSHRELWQPDHATLLAAGVIHRVLPASPDQPVLQPKAR